MSNTSGAVQKTIVNGLTEDLMSYCDKFEEFQLSNERFQYNNMQENLIINLDRQTWSNEIFLRPTDLSIIYYNN